MSSYLITGQGAPTAPAAAGDHLPTTRPRRYPSDTSDAEWEIIAPYIPVGGTTSKGGSPLTYSRRDIVDAIRYLNYTSAHWRALPADFPPWSLVYSYFRSWNRTGILNVLHNSLREQVRAAEGRTRDPSAGIIDAQSVRAAETVGRPSRGYDAGKNVNGRKRHIAVDTCGWLLVVMVTAASIQDRDAAWPLLWALRTSFPRIRLIWADGGYAGKLVTQAAGLLGLAIAIVRKLAGQIGFHVLPRRWVVERTLAWINRSRRTVRDYERLPEHHAAWVQWAMVTVMARRLARHQRAGRLSTRPA